MNLASAAYDGYLREMSEKDIAGFRAQAEECRLQAERSIRGVDKEAWPRMAGEWDKLAQAAQRFQDRG